MGEGYVVQNVDFTTGGFPESAKGVVFAFESLGGGINLDGEEVEEGVRVGRHVTVNVIFIIPFWIMFDERFKHVPLNEHEAGGEVIHFGF